RLENDDRRESEREVRGVGIGMSRSEAEAGGREQRECTQYAERAEQSELLADHREDKIGVCLRQIEHLLPPGAEPDTERPPRTESEQRLYELEAALLRVSPGIEERGEPLPAVAGSDGAERHERQHQAS